jgi:hypothetical protein
MSPFISLPNTPHHPHVVACVYGSENDSLFTFNELVKWQSSSFGLVRVLGVDGRTIVIACADNQATAHYVARLPWGAGTPIALADEDCTIIAAQRAESAQQARASANTTLTRENTVFTPSRPLALNRSIPQFQALNNDASPWQNAGGISSATCPRMSDAARIHELLITELGAAFPGIPVAVEDQGTAVSAVVADTAEANLTAARTLERLAGCAGYQPDPDLACELWAIRTYTNPEAATGASRAALPCRAAAPANRSGRGERVTRNQPCPCGSGIKYKRCCGR